MKQQDYTKQTSWAEGHIPESFRHKAYIRRREAADVSGLSVAQFERLSWAKQGPPTIKKGRVVLYPVPEFFAWLASSEEV
jgi:predicted DNA-binding transcriptional regulator AlpA